MARLLVQSGESESRAIDLKPGVNRLGRSSANHFQIPDPTVSSVHCEVVLSESSVLVRDLGSTNGTYIDGRQIREATLEPGQRLHLGSVEMLFDNPEPVPHIAIPPMPDPVSPEAEVLPNGTPMCLNHSHEHAIWKCTQCQLTFCDACVRIVKRVGGTAMVFCPSCRGQCESIGATPVRRARAAAKAKSFLGRVTKTQKIPLQTRAH